MRTLRQFWLFRLWAWITIFRPGVGGVRGKKGEGLSWFSCPQDLEQSFSVVFNLPGATWHYLEKFLIVPTGRGIWWVGTRDVLKAQDGPIQRRVTWPQIPTAGSPALDAVETAKGLQACESWKRKEDFMRRLCTEHPSLKDTWRLTYPPSSKSMKKKKTGLEFFVRFCNNWLIY